MAMRDPRRSKPSKKELELSERAKREPEKVRREIVTDQEKRRIVGQYGLDIEDYDDLMKMGPRPQRETFSGLTGTVPYMMDDHRSAAWDKRLKELQDRAVKRRSAKRQREVEDYDATIRGEKTPTQIEAEEKVKQPPVPAVQPSAPAVRPSAPAEQPPVPAVQPSAPALNPASGAKRAAAPSRAPLVAVNRNDRTGTTVTVNGQGMRPTAENVSLVNSIQRQRLLDAPTGVDVTSPLYTNAEVRLMRRNAAQIQMDKDRIARLQAIEDRSRARADARAWENGSLRGDRDWKHYGEVANTGGDGWKKGGKEYTDAMSSLREKMKTLTGLADQGLLHADRWVTREDVYGRSYQHNAGNPRKSMGRLYEMIDKADSGEGLSQKQIEVANAQVDRLLGIAQERGAKRDAERAYRMNRLREDLGLAEGTSDSAVLKADQDRRTSAINGALVTLGNPETWNSPDYYRQLEILQKNLNRDGSGLASAFSSAMKDPAMRDAYNADVRRLRSMPNSDVDLAELQNKYAVVGLQRQRGLGELNLRASPVKDVNDPVLDDTGAPLGQEQETIQPKAAPQQDLTDEQKGALGIQAAYGAGDVLRPRRKGVL